MKDAAPLSTLGYAVLGLLARAARSGYDLIRLLEEPVGFFWRARRSQIYPELARLHAAGLITFEVVVRRGGRGAGNDAARRGGREPFLSGPDGGCVRKGGG